MTVSGPGLERELKVPSSSTAELDVSVEPIRTVGRGDRRAIAVVRIAAPPGGKPGGRGSLLPLSSGRINRLLGLRGFVWVEDGISG